MSHNVKFSSLSQQTALICNSKSFALTTVIDRLEGRTGRVVHFLLHFIRHPNNHSGSGCGLVSNFFFLHNFVDFARRDMCDTCMKSCAHGLYFVFLYLRALCNLWGRYDPKTEKNADFLLATVSFLVIETSEIPQLKALTSGSTSSSYTDEL